MSLKGLHLIHQYRLSQLISILAKVKKNSATGEVGETDQLVESFRTNQGRTLSVCCSTPRETRWSNVSFPSQHMPEADLPLQMENVTGTCPRESEAVFPHSVAAHTGHISSTSSS